MKKLGWFVAVLVAALMVLACGAGGNDDQGVRDLGSALGSSPAPATESTEPTTAERHAAQIKQQAFLAGDWLVPSEAKVGTYKGAAVSGGHCYWERHRSVDGTFDDLIQNGNAEGDQIIVVRLTGKDKLLRLEGDCMFVRQQKR